MTFFKQKSIFTCQQLASSWPLADLQLGWPLADLLATSWVLHEIHRKKPLKLLIHRQIKSWLQALANYRFATPLPPSPSSTLASTHLRSHIPPLSPSPSPIQYHHSFYDAFKLNFAAVYFSIACCDRFQFIYFLVRFPLIQDYSQPAMNELNYFLGLKNHLSKMVLWRVEDLEALDCKTIIIRDAREK